jgi:small subunit ribosomal protein S20
VAHHQDAIKRIKQNAKRRARNRHFRTRMRTQVKRVREAIAAGNADEASAQLQNAISLIHRVASKGVIHRNQASRKISRLNRAVKNLSA